MKINAHLIAFLIFGLMISTVSAVFNVNLDVSLPDSTINVGNSFNVQIEIANTESENLTNSDIDVEIYVAGTKVYEDTWDNIDIQADSSYIRNVSSSDFEDVWKENLMDYDCGTSKEIKVSISGDDISSETNTDADLEISGDNFDLVDMEPENPTKDDSIVITVEDKDGDEFNGAKVRFTNLGTDKEWDHDDYDDNSKEMTTNRSGEVSIKIYDKFKDKPNGVYGEYQVDIWAAGYCKNTETFEIGHNLSIGAPSPEKPIVEQPIRVVITDETGKGVPSAKVTVSGGGISMTMTTLTDGSVTFTLNNTGEYTIYAEKEGFSTTKTISVYAKPTLEITFIPTNPSINNVMTIAVTSSGNSVGGVTVRITQPDGNTITLPGTTTSDGKITYKPSLTGSYVINASKSDYSDAIKIFQAFNTFSVTLPDVSLLKTNNDVTVIVKDQNANPVSSAVVSVSGTSISGTTDSNGKYTFNLKESGRYTMTVKKDGFGDYSVEMTVQCTLSTRLSSKEVETKSNITITAIDENTKNQVSSNIRIITPDGSEEKISAASYFYSPKIAGDYQILLSRDSCTDASANFTAIARSLNIELSWIDDTLSISLRSHNEPVSGVIVKVKTPTDEEKYLTTDEKGIATLNATEDGSYTVSVSDKAYIQQIESTSRSPVTSFLRRHLFAIIVVIILIIIVIVVIAIAAYFIYKWGKGRTLFEKGKSNL